MPVPVLQYDTLSLKSLILSLSILTTTIPILSPTMNCAYPALLRRWMSLYFLYRGEALSLCREAVPLSVMEQVFP